MRRFLVLDTISFSVDKNSKVKLYRQLSDAIIAGIQDGTVRPHSKLPSIRNLSEELGISKNTITKAYADLEQNGYIYSESKKGYFVSKPPAAADADLPPEPVAGEEEPGAEPKDAIPTVDFILRQKKQQQRRQRQKKLLQKKLRKRLSQKLSLKY